MANNKIDLTFNENLNKRDILVARFYSASSSWNALCRYLWQECENTPKYRIAINSICALSIELSLKTILAICGCTEKCLRKSGHSLVSLLKKIGTNNYNVIRQSYEKISGRTNFDEALKANDNSFNKWRYIIPENKSTDFIDDFDYAFMRWLQEVSANLAETAHESFLKEKKNTK